MQKSVTAHPPSVPAPRYQSHISKALWLVILCFLVCVSTLIVPRIPTPRPAIDSKMLVLRYFLLLIAAFVPFAWPTLTRRRWTLADTAFASCTAAFITATLFSSNLLYSLNEFWHLGGIVAVGWVCFRLSPVARQLYSLFIVIGMVTFIASAYGFLTYIGHDVLRAFYPFKFEENQGGRNFIHSFFGNPEYFAGYAAPGAIILLGLTLYRRKRYWISLIWAAILAFVLLVVLLSGSRTALAGFLVASLFVLKAEYSHYSADHRRLFRLALAGLLLAGAAVAVIFSTPNPLNRRDTRLIQRFTDAFNFQSNSSRERVIFYLSTTETIPNHLLFGHGPGTYRLEFLNNLEQLADAQPAGAAHNMLLDLNPRIAEHSHNDYLEIWFDQGLLGLASFLLVFAAVGSRYYATRRYLKTISASGWLVNAHSTLFAAIATFAINALTSFPFQMPSRASFAWIIIGCFFAADYRLAEARANPEGISAQNLSPETQETA